MNHLERLNLNIGKTDIIGDVHGCYTQLLDLMNRLGYQINSEGIVTHPEKRKMIFVGDLTDRGSQPIEVLKLLMTNHKRGNLFTVLGNHDEKLMRGLQGNPIKAMDELKETMNIINLQGKSFVQEVIKFIQSLPLEIYIESLSLRVVHGAIPYKDQTASYNIRKKLALYGDITGKTLEDGRPERLDWAMNYHGKETVVYGHTIVEQLEWVNNTIDIDLGCFRTGRLAAVRMPEKEVVVVPD